VTAIDASAEPETRAARRGRPARSAGAVVLLLIAAACSGGDDGAEAPPEDQPETEAAARSVAEAFESGAAGFYEPPDPLPDGEHGDLLRYQPVADPPEDVSWYRVMYLSETVQGEPIAVTGTVVVPDGDPPGDGWPLMSHAHGSTGFSDECAPSVGLESGSGSTVETQLLSSYAPEWGYVVASTDYEGSGPPGPHPWLVGESEGRGVLDIAIAARHLPGVEIDERTAIAGYSQGGHAALWANQISADWAPELDIVGTMAGAPASELATLVRQRSAVPEMAVFQVMMAGSFAKAYPEANAEEILTPAGLDMVDTLDELCDDQAVELTEDPEEPWLQAELVETEPWATLLEENTPGSVATPAPVLVLHSADDEAVPVDHSVTLLDRQCAASQVVERRILEGNHVGAAVPAYEQALDWFDELSSGTPPVSSCP
jgi:predicted esterase